MLCYQKNTHLKISSYPPDRDQGSTGGEVIKMQHINQTFISKMDIDIRMSTLYDAQDVRKLGSKG